MKMDDDEVVSYYLEKIGVPLEVIARLRRRAHAWNVPLRSVVLPPPQADEGNPPSDRNE